MVRLGAVPAGLLATGRAELLIAGDGGVPAALSTAVVAFFTLSGVVLAAAGANVLRHGQSESGSRSFF